MLTKVKGSILGIGIADQTKEAKTWYVDSVLGSDILTNGTALGASAFKTIQYAYDSIPTVVKHEQIIQLADGTYNTSSVLPGDQPRPAILWGKGKITTSRSYGSGANVNAMISIRGNSSDATAVKIETGSSYTYGIYINKGNIGLQDLTIKSDGINKASALLVAHRTDTYIHAYNVIIDGVTPAYATAGINAESSGQVEFVQGASGAIKNCTVGAQALTSGDNISISCHGSTMFSGCTRAVLAKSNSWIALNAGRDGDGKTEIIDSTNTIGIEAIGGAQVDVRGQDTNTDMAQINAPITIEDGANLTFVFAESLDTVNVKNATVKYNASNYQKNIVLFASVIHLKTSNSYVSPATANTDVRPIQLLNDSIIYKENTNNINGSGGLTVPTLVPVTHSFTANSEGFILLDGRNILNLQSNSGNHWTGCYIDSANVTEGRTIYVYGGNTVDGVTLDNVSGDMDLANAIAIGNAVGEYRGATFTMVNNKWRLVGLGQKRV